MRLGCASGDPVPRGEASGVLESPDLWSGGTWAVGPRGTANRRTFARAKSARRGSLSRAIAEFAHRRSHRSACPGVHSTLFPLSGAAGTAYHALTRTPSLSPLFHKSLDANQSLRISDVPMTVNSSSPPPGVPPSNAHYEPLQLDSSARSPESTMGYDEQFVKPEGRRGDVPAMGAALVRLVVLLPTPMCKALALMHNHRSRLRYVQPHYLTHGYS